MAEAGRDPAATASHRRASSSQAPSAPTPALAREPIPALVPEGGFFEGQIALMAETRIDGAVTGSVRGSGRLLVGPQARIDGVIECDAVEVRGMVVGPIRASARAQLEPGAHVEGDLATPALEVADEAVWNGSARIGEPAATDLPESGSIA